MRVLVVFSLLCLLAVLYGRAGTAPGPAEIGWFDIQLRSPSLARQASEDLRKLLVRPGLVLVQGRSLLERLRRYDNRAGLPARAAELVAQGKKLHLGMKLDQAREKFRQAAELLRGGLCRYYEPALLAEPLLQLGVALLDGGRTQAAARAFGQALSLVPDLELSEGYYSPKVRELFSRVRTSLGLPAPALPPPGQAERICRAAGLAGLVAFSAERLGDQPVLKVGVFSAKLKGYQRLETVVVSNRERAARQLAERLLPDMEALAGLTELVLAGEPAPAPDAGEAGPVPDAGTVVLATDSIPPPPETPWYWKHWWIWPLAAALVSTAVALPLTVFRHDVVRLDVH